MKNIKRCKCSYTWLWVLFVFASALLPGEPRTWKKGEAVMLGVESSRKEHRKSIYKTGKMSCIDFEGLS